MSCSLPAQKQHNCFVPDSWRVLVEMVLESFLSVGEEADLVLKTHAVKF